MAVSNALKTSGAYESLIQTILTYENRPKATIEQARGTQESFKSVLSELDSTLSALHTLVKSFTEPITNPFAARIAQVPDGSPFSITTTGSAAYGSHSVIVDRLATTDQRVSKQLSRNGNDLRASFDAVGTQTFTLSVASPTAENADNRVDVSVSVTATGTTNEEILTEIDAAIAAALDDAVTAGTIRSSERPAVSMARETSDTIRLSMRAGGTGYQSRLQMTDTTTPQGGQPTFLDLLEINANNVVGTSTSGGMIVDVGTSETDSELNALLEVDGLLLYRSSNQIDDAIPGLSISLNGISDFPTDFVVDADSESIVGNLDDFIEKYNAAISMIGSQSQIDGDTGFRGVLANDTSFTGLRFSMRSSVSRGVTGQSLGAPSFLGDIGIKVNNDGTLEISDRDKLIDAVKKDSGAVQSFFGGDDGVAKRLETTLESFVGSSGLIKARKNTVDDRIDRLNDRITAFDDRMSRRETQLRAEYARLEQALSQFQSQQQWVSAVIGG